MGTPPAPDWATLYFCIWEIIIIPQFPELVLFRIYIDDGFGIWTPLLPDTAADTARFQEFTTLMSEYGINHEFFTSSPLEPLDWESSNCTKSAVFLNLNITLCNNGSFYTTIYEKALNLYLYINPHSCHAPGVTKGLIYGMVDHAKALCSDPKPFLQKYLTRLITRGHCKTDILPVFHAAIVAKNTKPPPPRPPRPNDSLMFHLRINPADPSARGIQSLFRSNVSSPAGKDPITTVPTENDTHVNFNQLTICYHGQ